MLQAFQDRTCRTESFCKGETHAWHTLVMSATHYLMPAIITTVSHGHIQSLRRSLHYALVWNKAAPNAGGTSGQSGLNSLRAAAGAWP